MNKKFTQLTEALKRVRLTSEEKTFIHSSLLTYMKMKPVRDERAVSQLASFSPFSLRPLFSRAVPVALVAVLVATSVTFAAGDALPGQALYGVKVNVIERVQVATAVGSEAEAKVQVELATKRLKEAEKLTVRGELNEATKTEIETRFKEHSEKIASSIEKIESTNAGAAVEVSSEVEASLNTHSNILERLGEKAGPEAQNGLVTLVQDVREVVKRVAASSEKVEEQITQTSDPEAARATVEAKRKTARTALITAQDFFAKKRDVFSEKTQSDVTVKLSLAEKAMIAGDEQIIEEKYVEAYRQFRQAQNMAHEAVVELETSLELNFEIDIGMSIATSTPPLIPDGTGTSTPSGAATSTPSGTDNGTSTQSGNGEATSTQTSGGTNSIINTIKNLGR